MGGIIDASIEHGMVPIVTHYNLNMEQPLWQIFSVLSGCFNAFNSNNVTKVLDSSS